MESAGNSNQKGDKEMAGQNPGVDGQLGESWVQVNGQLCWSLPGQRIRGKTRVITDQDVVVNRHETRGVQRCVLGADVESAPARQGTPGIIS